MSLPRVAFALAVASLSALHPSLARAAEDVPQATPAASPSPVPVAPPTDAARAEARERFARALRLFNENDNAAALAEFLRVYELVPNPVVLYNIGLVQAAMSHPVEAVDTLDRLLARPDGLSPDQLARARSTRAAEAERVGSVVVKTNVPNASVEVDNLEVALTAGSAGVNVSSGTHVVAAVVPGYVPARKAVSVAGRAATVVTLELLPMQGQLAHLVVRTALPGADVLVDGQAVGVTPLPGSLSLAPGKHRVSLRRSGYELTGEDVTLGDGATGEVSFEPVEDQVLAGLGGEVELVLHERDVVVTVDGHVRGAYSGPFHLPAGPHRLKLERAGFFPVERDVTVPSQSTVQLPVLLEPTADTLAAYTGTVRAKRRAGWIAVVAGGAVAATGLVVLAVDAGQRSSNKSQYDTLTGQLLSHTGPCNFAGGGQPSQCYAPINSAADGYNSALTRDALGYALLGVGVVGLATGAVLLVTSGDVHRYDKPQGPAVPAIASLRLDPVVTGGPGAGFVGLRGAF